MTTSTRHALRMLMVSCALTALAAPAFANGQGTPIEPAPDSPAPVMIPSAPEPAPVMAAPRARWSGLYIGGHAGYAFMAGGDDETILFDTDRDGAYGDAVRDVADADIFAPGFCNGTAAGASAAAGCDDDSGGLDAGLRIGYDWDMDGFVLGALLEGSYVDMSDSVTAFSTAPDAYQFTRDLNFLGAARLRAGVTLADDWLLYATGGIAYGSIDRSFTATNAVNSFTEIEDNGGDGSWGWQAGGGIETMLDDNWSLGAEYLYTSLGDDAYAIAVGPGTALPTDAFLLVDAGGTNTIRDDDRFEIHSVRAVLNYRFGAY